MQKMILVDYSKCSGCRYCETACSARNEGVCNPYRSRIKVMRSEMEGFVAPMLCQQCIDAPCARVCPVRALSRDNNGLGLVRLDYDLCIGCKMCMVACPFGAMKFDEQKMRLIKCDFCDGDPACVKACSTDALLFVDATEADAQKRSEIAEDYSEVEKRFA